MLLLEGTGGDCYVRLFGDSALGLKKHVRLLVVSAMLCDRGYPDCDGRRRRVDSVTMFRAGGREEFDRLVREAIEYLPEDLAARMSNVDIVIEDAPDPGELVPGQDHLRLLGLYQGIPLTDRGDSYIGVLPDRITLYQNNIERLAKSARDLKNIVRRTVIHEIAHHFGIDDDRLEELGWA